MYIAASARRPSSPATTAAAPNRVRRVVSARGDRARLRAEYSPPWRGMTNVIRWGMVGCGDVTEVKSGPGFQKADGSTLLAVMRRDRARAEDYARRHGVPRVHARAWDLMVDPDVDAVYVATPPS